MAIHPATAGGGPQITGAIRQAAQSTGISFEYLLTTAQIESNMNPSAQASTSSAKGLYQFIDQTWLGTMKQDGAALGLGQYADAISRSSGGHYEVSDPAMRAAILRLRNDPQASAMLAGALTRNNATLVGSNIGRQPSNGELYIAHFLGADGAGKLINAASGRPQSKRRRHVSQRGCGKPQHLLRSLWPRAQRWRGLQQADQTFRHGPCGCFCAAGRDDKCCECRPACALRRLCRPPRPLHLCH